MLMNKIPYDQLIDMLTAARSRVEPGTTWRHYKGGEYVANNVVLIEATDEVSVLYSSVLRPEVFFVRPMQSWLETIERNGETQSRFVKI
jgi:hypothetical protein